MSINRFRPHVVAIPEDRANEQLATGFQQYYAVNYRSIDIKGVAGGWLRVLEMFEKEYVRYLRNYQYGHIVMLVDFDKQGEVRRGECEQRIPDDLKPRVFVLGTGIAPEDLRSELNLTFEEIGGLLARDRSKDDWGQWRHPHLVHNLPVLERLLPVIKPIVFQNA